VNETMTPEQAWEDAKKHAADDRENTVQDGTYTATTNRAEVGESKNSKRPMLTIEFKITGPSAQGRLVWLRHLLDRMDGWPFLARDLAKFDIDLDGVPSLGTLQMVLGRMLDQDFRITVKTSGEYTNIRILERLDGGSVADREGLPF